MRLCHNLQTMRYDTALATEIEGKRFRGKTCSAGRPVSELCTASSGVQRTNLLLDTKDRSRTRPGTGCTSQIEMADLLAFGILRYCTVAALHRLPAFLQLAACAVSLKTLLFGSNSSPFDLSFEVLADWGWKARGRAHFATNFHEFQPCRPFRPVFHTVSSCT